MKDHFVSDTGTDMQRRTPDSSFVTSSPGVEDPCAGTAGNRYVTSAASHCVICQVPLGEKFPLKSYFCLNGNAA
jgi:hypothetical protein